MTPRIEKAIDIFLDAINEKTLVSRSCSACAVGNLVAHGYRSAIIIDFRSGTVKVDGKENYNWSTLFLTNSNGQKIRSSFLNKCIKLANETGQDLDKVIEMNPEEIDKNKECNMDIFNKGMEDVRATDFTLSELMQIEKTFERNASKANHMTGHTKQEIRQSQIEGLKAVVELMMTFDDAKENVDEVFTNKAEVIPIV